MERDNMLFVLDTMLVTIAQLCCECLQELKGMVEQEQTLFVLETMLVTVAHLGSVLPSDRSRLLACATLVDHLDNPEAGIRATVLALFRGKAVDLQHPRLTKTWRVYVCRQMPCKQRCLGARQSLVQFWRCDLGFPGCKDLCHA